MDELPPEEAGQRGGSSLPAFIPALPLPPRPTPLFPLFPQVRAGNILEVDGKLMQVIKCSHTQGTARQLGNVQLELRDVLTRSKHPMRLRPGDAVFAVRLEDRPFQFLYQEDAVLHCMDPQTFEQVAVERDLLGEAARFLKEGGALTLCFHDGAAVAGSLPSIVTLKVAEAAPHLKGETSAPQYQPAVLETGVKVQVPPLRRSWRRNRGGHSDGRVYEESDELMLLLLLLLGLLSLKSRTPP